MGKLAAVKDDTPAVVDAIVSPEPKHEEDEHLSESLFHSCIDASEFFDTDGTADAPKQEDTEENHKIIGDAKTETSVAVNTIDEEAQDALIMSPIPPSDGAPNSSSTSSWSHIPTPQTKVNSIIFNRERTCLILATSHGVRIRTLESLHYNLFQTQRTSNASNNLGTGTNSDNIDNWICDIPFESGATYAQLHHVSSILAVIPSNSPRCCFLHNPKNPSKPLAVLPMSTAIKRVELTKNVLVCITSDGKLHIFHIKDVNDGEKPVWIQTLSVMHRLDNSRNITRGHNIHFSGSYFDLSSTEEECYLVCKSSNGTSGTVRVYDPTKITEVQISSMNASVNSGARSAAASAHSGGASKSIRRRCHLHTIIDAHEHPVSRMMIGSGSNSSFVATVSSKGTVIRVFGLPNGQQLYEWHRGSRSCQILSLSWNGLGDRLVCYGSSNTIHVFHWNLRQRKNTKSPSSENRHRDVRDFEEVREDNNRDNPTSPGSTHDISEISLYKRIGATIRHHTVGGSASSTPLKYRSFAKIKYQNTLPKNHRQLVVAMLDRCDKNIICQDKKSESSREDTVVVCSSDGELRQYSVKLDGSTKLVQLEDVLVAGGEEATWNQSRGNQS